MRRPLTQRHFGILSEALKNCATKFFSFSCNFDNQLSPNFHMHYAGIHHVKTLVFDNTKIVQ